MEVLGNALICLAGLLWGIEMIPQIMKIYKHKNVESISPLFFVICLIAYILYILGNSFLNNWIIVVAHIPSLFFNVWILLLLKKYSKG